LSTPSLSPSRAPSKTLKAILWGGFLGGCGDLGFAFVFYGMKGASMQRVMQSVAAGLLGKPSFEGGAATAVLGVILHYTIACGAAATYVLANRRIPALTKHAIPTGMIFGFGVYLVMNMVVLPLSALHTKAWPLAWAPYPMLGHILLVGLPIALVARHYARKG
jgi:hypothetical protein